MIVTRTFIVIQGSTTLREAPESKAFWLSPSGYRLDTMPTEAA
ncbi:hypothetical protein [Pseudomonas luteola]|nr:hypothetical protein [Pseudomonas luteola]